MSRADSEPSLEKASCWPRNQESNRSQPRPSSGRRLGEQQRGRGTPRHCPSCDLSLEAPEKDKSRGSELTENVCGSPCVLSSFALLWIKYQTATYSIKGLLWLMTSDIFIPHGGEAMAESTEVGARDSSLSHWRATQEAKRSRPGPGSLVIFKGSPTDTNFYPRGSTSFYLYSLQIVLC